MITVNDFRISYIIELKNTFSGAENESDREKKEEREEEV